MTDKYYFCGENKLCITENCSNGKELLRLPAFSVPEKTILYDPEDPRFKDMPHGTTKIHVPLWDERETYLEFVDGSKQTVIGKVKLVRGCENKNEL